jgi:hypothetical protein
MLSFAHPNLKVLRKRSSVKEALRVAGEWITPSQQEADRYGQATVDEQKGETSR